MTRRPPPGSRSTWGGTASWTPARVVQPASEEEVVAAVRAAVGSGTTLRPVGSGHSFTPLAATDGIQLDLSRMTGLLGVDTAARTATLAAGTPLHAVPALLEPHGLAMANLGDIDRQTLAGAVATGTHGTGLAFGGLATQVVGMRLVTGRGEVLDVGLDDPLLPALAPGLGALGVVTALTLQLVDAFVLRAEERREPLDRVLDDLPRRCREHDHVEFYWFPHTRWALTKTNTRLPAGTALDPLPWWRRRLDEDLLANGVFALTCRAGAAAPAAVPLVNRAAAVLSGSRTFTDRSHRVFTTRRAVRFRETEYAVPLDALVPAARAVVRLVERRRWRVSFPLEFRVAAADERWLSTAYGRDSGYVAAHRSVHDGEDDYLAEVERVLVDHGGRPHWGKLHSRTAADLAVAYPRFGDVLAVRDRLDPDRVLTNPHLQRVLGA